jgi:hypothetical protein
MSIEFYILILLVILYIYNEKCDVKIFGIINFFAKHLKLTSILLVFLVVTFHPNLLLYYYDANKTVKHSSGSNYTSNGRVKRNVSESKKKFVASNQQWKCAGCNELLDATYEIDHINPLYKGGTNEVSNLKALCRNCHGKKTLMDRIS